MNIDLPSNRIVWLCGDLGYISKRQFNLNNGKRVKIIAKKRRNQLIDTPKELELLKKRATVEIALSYVKKYNRLMVRRDKNIQIILDRFMGLIDIFCKKVIMGKI